MCIVKSLTHRRGPSSQQSFDISHGCHDWQKDWSCLLAKVCKALVQVCKCLLQGGLQQPTYMYNGYMMTYYPPIPTENMPMYNMENGTAGIVTTLWFTMFFTHDCSFTSWVGGYCCHGGEPSSCHNATVMHQLALWIA